jgi:hypothetical protein
MGDRRERASRIEARRVPALAWALAIAFGLTLWAAGCDGPGLEPPFMGARGDAGPGASAGTGGKAGGASGSSGAGGKGGSGGAAGAQAGKDAGTELRDAGAEELDGGSDEDAGSTR